MDPKYSDNIEKATNTDDMFTMRYTLVVGGLLLAALSMSLATCAFTSSVQERRMKYCIDAGNIYVWDRNTNGVSCYAQTPQAR